MDSLQANLRSPAGVKDEEGEAVGSWQLAESEGAGKVRVHVQVRVQEGERAAEAAFSVVRLPLAESEWAEVEATGVQGTGEIYLPWELRSSLPANSLVARGSSPNRRRFAGDLHMPAKPEVAAVRLFSSMIY